MNIQPKILAVVLKSYLVHIGYQATYFSGENRAYYNPRSRQNILIPINQQSFTKEEITQIFIDSKAIDMPPEIEWYRLQIFIYSQTTKSFN